MLSILLTWFVFAIVLFISRVINGHAIFGNVLLIIEYSYDNPTSQISLQNYLYSMQFKNQILIGPFNETKIHAIRKSIPSNNTHIRSSLSYDYKGYYGYLVAAHAMKLLPNFDGYLFVQDDVVFDFSRIVKLNLESVWITFGSTYYLDMFEFDESSDRWRKRDSNDSLVGGEGWLPTNHGIPAILRAISKDEYISTTLKNCSNGRSGLLHHGLSDIFYIPQNLRTLFIHVATKFDTEKLFVEYAVPTFLKCFVPSETSFQYLEVCTYNEDHVPQTEKIQRMMECDPSLFDYYHPIKLSLLVGLQFMINRSGLLHEEDVRNLDTTSVKLLQRVNKAAV